MTWPAPDLRIDFQNATVSADTHPAAHNDTNLSLNDDYRPEIVRIGNELLTYLPLSGGAVTGDLQVDGQIVASNGNAATPSIHFKNSPDTGFFRNSPGKIRMSAGGVFVQDVSATLTTINTDLQVDGAIQLPNARADSVAGAPNMYLTTNGNVRYTTFVAAPKTFNIADGIDTADILNRAETATMPVVDDEGVATTDADVESVTVNEVVTALLAKVKQLTARIEALETAG